MNEKYLIVFDNGKPQEKLIDGIHILKHELKILYLQSQKEDNPYMDIFIYHEGKDITETQFIGELMGDIIEECAQ